MNAIGIGMLVKDQIERDFRPTVQIERQSKKGVWKPVPMTFAIEASSTPGMIATCVWHAVETKRRARYRGLKNGKDIEARWWLWGQYIDVGESFRVTQPINFTTSDLG